MFKLTPYKRSLLTSFYFLVLPLSLLSACVIPENLPFRPAEIGLTILGWLVGAAIIFFLIFMFEGVSGN
jgi:hypothetical protein